MENFISLREKHMIEEEYAKVRWALIIMFREKEILIEMSLALSKQLHKHSSQVIANTLHSMRKMKNMNQATMKCFKWKGKKTRSTNDMIVELASWIQKTIQLSKQWSVYGQSTQADKYSKHEKRALSTTLITNKRKTARCFSNWAMIKITLVWMYN